MSDGRTAYRGPHDPQPDGRCRHRWANRVTRVVFCGYPAGVAARDAELRAAVEGLPEQGRWGAEYAMGLRDQKAAILALLTPPDPEAKETL